CATYTVETESLDYW
nr:immunoglobulin heavy chain junction region [Macaca mulatta]MOY21496.1 immunoglobulin heavy chain junction region [Macaca mulatta]MOY22058.1 immunoglobulin heavy chain junction region [Macaca mulatta]MOY22443.1 immunoglobulin heavy chain junction region [Macaca mulatta]MOY23019.1 immunoglobulin heavy chain junction region [Macaca mulatta]